MQIHRASTVYKLNPWRWGTSQQTIPRNFRRVPRHLRLLASQAADDSDTPKRRRFRIPAAPTSTELVLNKRQDLKDSGFDDLQAEAVLRVCEKTIPEAASKSDLTLLKEQLSSKMNLWFLGLLFADFITAIGSAGPDSPIGKISTALFVKVLGGG